jgi:hypothetical protein
LPSRNQITFGGGPSAADSRGEVSVFGHDRQALPGGVRPDRKIIRGGQPGQEHLF